MVPSRQSRWSTAISIAWMAVAPGLGAPLTTHAVTWIQCPSSISSKLECADITVPLDYDEPSGESLSLKLVRLPSPNPSKCRGSVVFQEGGPGEITSDWLKTLAESGETRPFSDDDGGFNLVVTDPRGVGLNHPVKCGPNFGQHRVPLYPTTKKEYDEAVSTFERFGKSCLKRTGKIMNYLDTLTQAKDLEAVRIAIGEGGLNYYGMSWGTLRGSLYAQNYPGNVRAMVLDSVVDHSANSIQSGSSGASAYSNTQRRMLEWMGKNPKSSLHGRDAVQIFHKLLKRADKTPIPVPGCNDSTGCLPTVTGDDIRAASFEPVNYPWLYWKTFSKILKDAYDDNNASSLAFKTSTSETGVFQSLWAINCQDYIASDDWESFKLQGYMNAELSLDATSNTSPRVMPLACPRWPTKVRNPPSSIQVQNASAPIMLVNGLWDPATGYDGAVNVNAQIEGSFLVTRYGEGHTSLPFPAVLKMMTEYFKRPVAVDPGDRFVGKPTVNLETDFEIMGWPSK